MSSFLPLKRRRKASIRHPFSSIFPRSAVAGVTQNLSSWLLGGVLLSSCQVAAAASSLTDLCAIAVSHLFTSKNPEILNLEEIVLGRRRSVRAQLQICQWSKEFKWRIHEGSWLASVHWIWPQSIQRRLLMGAISLRTVVVHGINDFRMLLFRVSMGEKVFYCRVTLPIMRPLNHTVENIKVWIPLSSHAPS